LYYKQCVAGWVVREVGLFYLAKAFRTDDRVAMELLDGMVGWIFAG